MKIPERTTICTHTITVVPRYAETDKGGVIHHSVYPVWFEMGRTELLRPVFYDEGLELETTCSNVTACKVEHTYRLIRPGTGLLLAEGSSILACVSGDGKVRRIPEFMHGMAE